MNEEDNLQTIDKSLISEIKKIDPKISDEDTKKLINIINQRLFSSIQILESHSGPLPKPEMLEKYDKVVPGAGERIIVMAEEQAKHRQKLEEKVVFSKSGDSRLGVWFAFILAFTSIICGCFLIYNNKSVEGLSTIITAIAALVGTFIFGKYQEKKELEKKEKMLISKK